MQVAPKLGKWLFGFGLFQFQSKPQEHAKGIPLYSSAQHPKQHK